MISGLVIHLSSDERVTECALREITAHPAIEIGERHQSRLPVIAETDDVAAMHELTDWLAARDGVTHVDVAFADVALADDEKRNDAKTEHNSTTSPITNP